MEQQQRQTLDYFTSQARQWQDKATRPDYSVIKHRQEVVIAVLQSFSRPGKTLDIGCGTGQLTLALAQRGWSATGVDYSPAMTDLCRQNCVQHSLEASFICESIFDLDFDPHGFDLITAMGFIEYISLPQLDLFFSKCAQWLKKGGKLVFGSRNRLFNIHSLNHFTEMELLQSTASFLLDESRILQSAATQNEAIEQLKTVDYLYEHPDRHPHTGVRVDTRYQFTPSELIRKLKHHHYEVENLYPVHFHALPLKLCDREEVAELHKILAQCFARDFLYAHNAIPYSSSFIVEACQND